MRKVQWDEYALRNGSFTSCLAQAISSINMFGCWLCSSFLYSLFLRPWAKNIALFSILIADMEEFLRVRGISGATINQFIYIILFAFADDIAWTSSKICCIHHMNIVYKTSSRQIQIKRKLLYVKKDVVISGTFKIFSFRRFYLSVILFSAFLIFRIWKFGIF